MKKSHLIIYTFSISLFLATLIAGYFITNGYKFDMWLSFDILSTILPLIILIAIAFKVFTNYLDNDSKNKETIKNEIREFNILKNDIEKLKNSTLTTTIAFTSEEKAELLTRLNEQFESNITTNYLKNIEKKFKLKEVEEAIQESYYRIVREIESLKRRGNINLYLGMILSLFGLAFLSNIVFTTTNYKNFEELIINILPRTLLVIFIEIFSFFFLNLYKKSLDEVKYFQNELTNLESKYLSLYLAKQSGNFKLLSNALDTLLKTERNFILKKDETTIELEKNRIEAQSSNNTVQALKDIINFKR